MNFENFVECGEPLAVRRGTDFTTRACCVLFNCREEYYRYCGRVLVMWTGCEGYGMGS